MNKLNELNFMINEIEKIKLLKIDIDEVNYMFKILEENKPIPINYYTNNIIITKNKNNCKICNKKSNYIVNNNVYCWIHVQYIKT